MSGVGALLLAATNCCCCGRCAALASRRLSTTCSLPAEMQHSLQVRLLLLALLLLAAAAASVREPSNGCLGRRDARPPPDLARASHRARGPPSCGARRQRWGPRSW